MYYQDSADLILKTLTFLQEEVKAGSILSVHANNIKVTEVVKEGDNLTFIIVSQKVKTKTVHV